MPINSSAFTNPLNDPFDISTQPISLFNRKRRSNDHSPEVTENPNAIGFDSEQNEHYEKHQVDAEIVESGTEPTNDPNEISDEESWFQEEKYNKNDDPMALKQPQNLGTSRWTVYKGMASIAERFEIFFRHFRHFCRK